MIVAPSPATLRDPLASRARRSGGRLALVDPAAGVRWGWRDLDAAAEAVAGQLAGRGVGRGDRVALLEPAGATFAAVLHGCLRLGAALVPLSPRSPGPDGAAALAATAPCLVLAGPAGMAAALAAAGGRGPAAPPVLGIGGAEGPAGRLEDGPSRPPQGPRGLPAGADCCLLRTSGTSGTPKVVRLTLGNHRASALGCQQSLGLTGADHWLLTLAPHHVGGLAILLRSVILGQPVTTVPGFEEGAVVDALRAERPTVVSLVPTMLHRLVDAGGAAAVAALRAILLGGAPAPPAAVARWVAAGLPVCPSYGLTESCSQVTVVPPGRAAECPGSAGWPHGGVRLAIRRDGAGPTWADPGEVGQIVIAGPVVSPGYLGGRARPVRRRGPLVTGDRGRLLADGRLEVVGRADDALLTGGELVQPDEVEMVLRAHPAVADAAVVGEADPLWGTTLLGLVVAPTATPEELVAWCRARLPSAKVPRRVRLVGALPRSEGGKLLRRALAALPDSGRLSSR